MTQARPVLAKCEKDSQHPGRLSTDNMPLIYPDLFICQEDGNPGHWLAG